MAQDDRRIELDVGLIAKRVKEDESDSSPQKRAEKVLAALLSSGVQLSNLDVICFAAEYLGSQVSVAPWLERVAKETLWAVYATYYVLKDEEFKWLDQSISSTEKK